MMTSKNLLAGTALAALLLAVPPALAQFAVIDVANLAENIQTAASTLEQVSNQVRQIQQFVQMLEYQARNVASLPFSVLDQITGSMDQVNGLMSEAQRLAYDVQTVETQFQSLYPTYNGAVSQAGLLSDARARWQASVDTFSHTMQVQSRIVSDISGDESRMAALVGQSQGAVGSLQAIQATNQLLALQARQMSSTQALLAASERAQAAEAMRHAETEEAARAEWQRFWGNGVGYTPAPVYVFGGPPP